MASYASYAKYKKGAKKALETAAEDAASSAADAAADAAKDAAKDAVLDAATNQLAATSLSDTQAEAITGVADNAISAAGSANLGGGLPQAPEGVNPMAAQVATTALNNFQQNQAAQGNAMSAGMAGAAGAGMVGAASAGMAGASMGGAASAGLKATAASAASAPASFANYQQPGKKSTCILSPHLETVPASMGSMNIALDNCHVSVSSDSTISGKVKIIMTSPLEALGITLNLCGFIRSHFFPVESTGSAD